MNKLAARKVVATFLAVVILSYLFLIFRFATLSEAESQRPLPQPRTTQHQQERR